MNCSIINVEDILQDLFQELSKGKTEQNFAGFLLSLVYGKNVDNGKKTESKSTSIFNEGSFTSREYALKSFINNYRGNCSSFITADELVPYFVEECVKRFVHVDEDFASYMLQLYIRDAHHDLCNKISLCTLEQFLQRCLEEYCDNLNPTICNMKMCYYYQKCPELDFTYTKQKYDTNSRKGLDTLVKSIMQYPETTKSPKDVEEMLAKMQIFIITNYSMGCPKNSEVGINSTLGIFYLITLFCHIKLMKQTRRSLESVLGKGDLQKYVLKKKYHRLEYLDRLGATVCGIITFNNYKNQGNKDNTRNSNKKYHFK